MPLRLYNSLSCVGGDEVHKRGHSISVLIPTLNEEDAIGKVLADIPRDVADETIVIDSSTDNTPKIAESMGVRVVHQSMRGYGRALQTGIQNANGDIVVYIDGDYSYDPKEILKVVQPILNGKCDVVLGSRLGRNMLPGSMSPLNRFGNLILSLIFDVLFLKRVRDTQSGFRAIRRKLLESVAYGNYGMPYVTEQLIKLVKKGAKVSEVPITYRPRIGFTKLCSWTDGFKILKTIMKGLIQSEKQ